MKLTRIRKGCWGIRKRSFAMPRTHPPYASNHRAGAPDVASTLAPASSPRVLHAAPGELLPVPAEFYNDRYVVPIAPSPLAILDPQGNPLAAVQFLPWQDGGVVILRGKIPLAPLLMLLGREKLKRGGAISRDGDLQLSYVLPITAADFTEMLTDFSDNLIWLCGTSRRNGS
jgi:hypothetical protein